MTWFGYFLVGYWAFNALGGVVLIGKRRQPITPEAAAVFVVFYALLIWGLVAIGTGP